MYKFVYGMCENHNTADLAAIVYMTSPYFFTDIYIRHALGEAVSFIFIPMVFLGLYNLLKTEKNHYYLPFGVAGLLLSHNISTMVTGLFALLYCIVNMNEFASTRVKRGLLLDIIFVLVITSFFWLPFMQTKFFTDYRAFGKDAMTTQNAFLEHRIGLKELLITKSGTRLVFEIGLPMIMMLVFSIMTIRRNPSNKKDYLFFLITGLLCAWMTTKYFPWKWLPNKLYIIQFPWRMLQLSSFFLAIVCSMNMTTVIKNFNGRDVMVITAICVIYLTSKWNLIPNSENVVDVKDYAIPSITGQNNEWLPGMGRLEYLPEKAYHNTFYIATRENEIIVLENNCEITNYTKIGNYMTARLSTKENDVKLELPFIYYPGYTVRFDGLLVRTYETENGFLGCTIEPNETGTIEVCYTGTNLMHITKIISVVGTVCFLIYVWRKH